MKMLIVGVLIFASSHLASAAPKVIPLWPEGVPIPIALVSGSAEERLAKTKPMLTVFGPTGARANGTAIIICPGGGYLGRADDHEGEEYARGMGKLGITSFLLRYRVRIRRPGPLQDVMRAVRLVRSEAARYGVNPDRIGVIGSSAGGHLSAIAGTLFGHPGANTGAELDKVRARPDFLMLIYPMITMEGANARPGPRRILLGSSPVAEDLQLLAVEKQVTSLTPPTLLIHTQEDQTVHPDHSILFYQALTRARVPAEMYLFQKGPHGMGMRSGFGPFSGWPQRAEEWLKMRGLLEPPK